MRARLVWLFASLVSVAAVTGCDTGRRGATTPAATAASAPTSDAELVRDALAARRAVAIQRLRAYREAAVYPVDERGLPVGVFRDARGVRCPMSELIFQSGRADLVDAVVRDNNRLRLADVHDGPLMAWMLESGLTQEEIVQVQGAMDWNEGPRSLDAINLPDVELSPESFEITAREAVNAKLVAAETMLRAGTATGLTIAAERLDARQRKALIAGRTNAPAAPAATTGKTRIASRPGK